MDVLAGGPGGGIHATGRYWDSQGIPPEVTICGPPTGFCGVARQPETTRQAVNYRPTDMLRHLSVPGTCECRRAAAYLELLPLCVWGCAEGNHAPSSFVFVSGACKSQYSSSESRVFLSFFFTVRFCPRYKKEIVSEKHLGAQYWHIFFISKLSALLLQILWIY